MDAKTRRAWLRFAAEYIAVFILVFSTSYLNRYLLYFQGYEPLSAYGRLRDPIFALIEVIIPMGLGALLIRFIARRRKMSHVIWREPEYVPPSLGGSAPTYAPPLDTSDDLLLGTALSSEPEPLYNLELQPRISRLWWLVGYLAVMAALIVIGSGIIESEISPLGVFVGLLGSFAWAFTQEYLHRGLALTELKRLLRGRLKPMIGSLVLTLIWMIPIAVIAASPTGAVIITLSGPILGFLTYVARRMFTVLWASIITQFLFISAFFALT
ncbi:MAG: hypothetical protein Q4E01_00635 [Actinomycetaceae bacterium]|nr:hypothetical protein [Actinomycetaceae bacterium]